MIDIKKEDLRLLLEAGYIFMAMGRLSQAKQVFEGVIELSPKNEIPQVALANVLFTQHKFLPAIRVLKTAIKLNENSAFAYSHLGEALLFYGRKPEASAALDKAISLEPRSHAAEFSRSLKELIKKGYDPVELKKAGKTGQTDKSA